MIAVHTVLLLFTEDNYAGRSVMVTVVARNILVGKTDVCAAKQDRANMREGADSFSFSHMLLPKGVFGFWFFVRSIL